VHLTANPLRSLAALARPRYMVLNRKSLKKIQVSKIDKIQIIGKHPEDGSFFSFWLSCEDDNDRENLHRKLSEKEFNDEIISHIAELVKKHHISEKQLKLSEKKKKILEKYGLDEFIESQLYFPDNENTKKGNLGEIILCEYLQETSNHKLLLYRLRYNPNVSKSMGGDDILLFNKDNIKKNIILGEAKFRIPANKSTVEEILHSFGGVPKLPLSLTFISNILRDNGNDDLADEIDELQIQMRKNRISIINVGFIISNDSAHKCVKNHHLYGDFEITQETIDYLRKDGEFPTDVLETFINKTFKTESAFHKAINKELENKKLPRLTTENKQKLFEYTEKKKNPNLIFITLSSANINKLLADSYKEAKKMLKKELKNELRKN